MENSRRKHEGGHRKTAWPSGREWTVILGHSVIILGHMTENEKRSYISSFFSFSATRS
jgi:hypothetical protein